MSEFRFQFQYDPNDLKTIRDATGIVRFSPGTTISVWAAGFAICLLILGAIGTWLILAIVVIAATACLMIYVMRLNRTSLADREYVVREVTFSESGVVEAFGNSMFEKSWDAFEEFAEGPEHLILRHYERVTAVPKRVIPQDQLVDCRNLIVEQVNKNLDRQVALFNEWFSEQTNSEIFKFRWRNEDIEKLSSSQMQVYNGTSATISHERGFTGSPLLPTVCLLLLIVFLMLFFNSFEIDGGDLRWFQILLFPVAISIPFFVALIWWKYTSNEAAKKRPRIPDEEIFISFNETDLMIGYPKAVARYSWKDITSLCYSDQFVGFRPNNGLVHVIANHAFGGLEGAMEFLRMAEKFRLECEHEFVPDDHDVQTDETGNPYQPPGYVN